MYLNTAVVNKRKFETECKWKQVKKNCSYSTAVDVRIDVKSEEQPENEASQPSVERILCLIADKYVKAAPLRTKDDLNSFLAYMKEMRLIITGYRLGSLLITVKCDSLQILERLWEDYSSGHLGEVVQRCFVTEEILTELSLADLKLETTISEEEYKACKMFLGKDSPKGKFKNKPKNFMVMIISGPMLLRNSRTEKRIPMNIFILTA